MLAGASTFLVGRKVVRETTRKLDKNWIGPMSTGMDVRLSADSEIKRLQEMVKRLENRNAQLKSSDVLRRPSKNMDQVRVQLGLKDVPLLDLKGGKLDDEDTWLFESPIHAPSPAQKSISPYKYLQHSVDTSELSRVRGSLMAKLESLSSQEVALRLNSDSSSPSQTDEKTKEEERKEKCNVGATYREPSFEELEEELEELQQLTVRLDYNSPVKRRGAKQIVPQTTAYSENSASLPRRMGPHVGAARIPDEEDDFMGEEEMNQTFVRHRGESVNHSVVNVSANDDEVDTESAPVSRRGSQPGTPRPRGALGPPQAAWADENEDEVSLVQPRRRGQVEETDSNDHGAVRRRPASRGYTARQPMKTEANSFAADYSSTQSNTPASRAAQTIPVLSAVRRRQSGIEGGGVQPRRSMSPQYYGTTPTRRSNVSHSLKPGDTDGRRRSLPQAPTQVGAVSKSENFGLKSTGSSTLPRRRGVQNESAPVPRASKLATPRRAVSPRGASPQPNDCNSSWKEGCF